MTGIFGTLPLCLPGAFCISAFMVATSTRLLFLLMWLAPPALLRRSQNIPCLEDTSYLILSYEQMILGFILRQVGILMQIKCFIKHFHFSLWDEVHWAEFIQVNSGHLHMKFACFKWVQLIRGTRTSIHTIFTLKG